MKNLEMYTRYEAKKIEDSVSHIQHEIFSKEMFEKAVLVEVHYDKGIIYEVLEVKQDGLEVHKLNKNGTRKKIGGASFVWFASVNVIYTEENNESATSETTLEEQTAVGKELSKLESLQQQKTNLEYTIEQLQEQLHSINEDIEKEEFKKIINKEAIKLTPSQEKIMDSIKNASWYYKHGKESINAQTYLDGKFLSSYSGFYIMGESRFCTEMSTSSLRALEKKGMLEIEHASDNGSLDLVHVPSIKTRAPFTRLYKVVFEVYSEQHDIRKNQTIYTLAEQVNDAIDAWVEKNHSFELVKVTDTELVDVTTWVL